MIAIVSSSARERTAFASLCESRRWACAECDSLRAFKKLIWHTRVQTVLVRHRLSDGYSDNVIAALAEAGHLPTPKIIVLLTSGTVATLEARQVNLGADCVLRDPVRAEVLLEYFAKYRRSPVTAHPAPPGKKEPSFRFAGARVNLVDRQLQRGNRTARLTPRQIELMEVLVESEGHVVSYHNLFGEIIGRRFRGDTSNLRVLLGLLDASARKVGISLRQWVEVIPKLGYRYRPPAGAPRDRIRKTHRKSSERSPM
jgi:DNA-binding response OmpR family regulator